MHGLHLARPVNILLSRIDLNLIASWELLAWLIVDVRSIFYFLGVAKGPETDQECGRSLARLQ